MASPTVDRDANQLRQRMVDKIRTLHAALAAQAAVPPLDQRVLAVMAALPRHTFVPGDMAGEAYANAPLGIGQGQTISQPFIVALMSSLAQVQPQHRVLEVGTGSGYQTAILAALAGHVFSIEAVAELAAHAAAVLRAQATPNISLRIGDGHAGWPEEAPFDAIVVTAAPPRMPPALPDQLAPGGRLIIPFGQTTQILTVVEKSAQGVLTETAIVPVRFVPMVPT
jgi:protein-L-isoaspartate(D-aspartate) O-methyltransferase